MTWSGWPLMPPVALVCSTTRSVEILRSAPSMAPTPVMSSSTPILIGLRFGGAAAPGLGALAGAVAAGAAGAQATARPQAQRTINAAARCMRGLPDGNATDLILALPFR